MTTQHTPGPWHVTGYHIDAPTGTVASVCDTGDDDAQGLANARLLAQAPALLKALQRLTHPMADDEDLRDALVVIARATGQPVPEPDEPPEPPYAGYENQADLHRMEEVRRLEALRAKGLIP